MVDRRPLVYGTEAFSCPKRSAITPSSWRVRDRLVPACGSTVMLTVVLACTGQTQAGPLLLCHQSPSSWRVRDRHFLNRNFPARYPLVV